MHDLSDWMEDFDPGDYLAALATVAHADGLVDEERAFLGSQAVRFGLDPEEALRPVEGHLGRLVGSASKTTRRMIVRDCIVLACVDGEYSANERARIAGIAASLQVSEECLRGLESWVERYGALLDEMQVLLTQA